VITIPVRFSQSSKLLIVIVFIFQDRSSNRLCSIVGICCASCHGRIRYVACLQQPESMKRILALGEVGSMWADWISLLLVAIVAILFFGRGGG
jgi:hypothetical protein